MTQNIVHSWPLGWIIVENLANEISGLVRDRSALWECILIRPDSLVGSLDVIGLKWRLADNKRVDDDAEGPDVYLVRVALLAFENLWCDIVRRSADRTLALSVELKLGCQAEITDFYFHLVVKEQIS